MTINNRHLKILLWVIVFQIIGAFIGFLTQDNIYTWYENLVKSNLTPPSIVFSIVWPIWYVCIAIAGYLLWEARHNPKIKPALYCFIIHLLMNWLWSIVFFEFHYIGLSFLWILIITLLTAAIMLIVINTMRMVVLLLTPYFLWLIFACYLNAYIWLYN